MLDIKNTLNLTLKQLILDYNIDTNTLENSNLIITEIENIKGSRFYNNSNIIFKLVIFQNKIFISTLKTLIPNFKELFKNRTSAWALGANTLRRIDSILSVHNAKMGELKQYFLPCTTDLKHSDNIVTYDHKQILAFRNNNRFNEAFAFDIDKPDIIGVSYIENNTIHGMAGASADSKYLYQIGIDVFNDYRGKGIGSILVSNIKNEVLKINKIPFYGTSISHIESQRLAIKSGFTPSFVELVWSKF